jgi:uncharacterized repeat protein (TIGR01451 family)
MMRLLLFILTVSVLEAQPITADLEYQKITGVGYSWQSVSLQNSYSDPVIVCSNVLPDKSYTEAVVRIRNVSFTGFQLKIQRPNDSDPGYVTDVYCVISDEGSYTTPIKYEAHKVLSDGTNGESSPNNWNASNAEEVTGSLIHSYTRAAVLGQVMSYNDSRFSVFWSFNCQNRGRRPFQSNNRICVGKHVGQIPETRNSETLGYIVTEAGIDDLEDFSMATDYGSNTIRGVGNNPPYTYTLDKSYTDGVVHQEAENGGQGGWSVLYGTSPLGTSLDMAIDEETVAGDTTRTHTAEEVAYWVFLYDPVTPAQMVVNEVLYRQSTNGTGNDEFVEFYVTQSGDLKNYLFTDQDGSSHHYRFPKHTVTTGDYVILHIGSGTDSVVGNVHHFYMGISQILNNTGDDIVLLRPSNTDTTVVDGTSLHVIPVDYMSYGSGGDPVPVSQSGVTVSWNGSENSRLSGADRGESIALTPNANDSDTSLCWELSATTVANEKATNCTNYIPTRDTNTDPGQTNSITKSNTASPNITITKTSIVLSDPINGSNNPKRIPGSTIRYCFTVDNTGEAAADNATLNDSLTGSGRDKLNYLKSGGIVQSINSACSCAALTDNSGTISGTDVTINLGTITDQTNAPSTARGCAYIEMTIQ